MEAFPEGGFFAGKNFVFDERVTVGPRGRQAPGGTLPSACSAPHDTYEPRRRCQRCRMLVLVCAACAAKVLPILQLACGCAPELWVTTARARCCTAFGPTVMLAVMLLGGEGHCPADTACSHVPEPVPSGDQAFMWPLTLVTDVHQGADAALLCELCLEKGLQADGIRSAVCAVRCSIVPAAAIMLWLARKASVSALGQDRLGGPGRQVAAQRPAELPAEQPCIVSPQRVANPPQHSLAEQASHCPRCKPVRRLQARSGMQGRAGQEAAHPVPARLQAERRQPQGDAPPPLARKLADLAELVYIDAPHPLPFVVKDSRTSKVSDCARHPERRPQDCDAMNEGQGTGRKVRGLSITETSVTEN